MKYLVDTNIWLEMMLQQRRAGEVRRFLEREPANNLVISEFTLYSIGLILIRLGKGEAFLTFLRETLIEGGVVRLRLPLKGLEEIPKWVEQFRLDFDDAYQYGIAETYGLTIVSFDKDFDRTSRGRITPEQALKGGSL